MADRNAIVSLATDIYKNKVNTKFGSDNMAENKRVLYDSLVEANGGTTLDYKTIRSGASNGLFAIIEEILQNTSIEGLRSNPFFQKFAQFVNLAEGDINSFHIPDDSLFIVSEVAHGVNGIRRQRINKGKNVSIDTKLHAIKAYEELRRLLSGRIDIIEFIDKMQKSMLEAKLELVYETFYNGLSELPSAFTVTGSFVEDSLIDIIQHVEISTGKTAMIIGTVKALRKVTTAVVSDSQKEDVYRMGHYGRFNSTEMMVVKQAHVADGSLAFKFSDADLWVVAVDTQPIKFVTEGIAIMEVGNMMDNADGTIDMVMTEQYNAGIVLDSLHGQYRIQ